MSLGSPQQIRPGGSALVEHSWGKGMCKNNKLDKIKEDGEKKENRMQH